MKINITLTTAQLNVIMEGLAQLGAQSHHEGFQKVTLKLYKELQKQYMHNGIPGIRGLVPEQQEVENER